MATFKSIRWLFKLSEWRPTLDQILHSFACLQVEERARISKFYFQQDALSSLVGRLLLRKLINDQQTSTSYDLIRFERDNNNKPILQLPQPPPSNSPLNLSFNVSHQGDYVVLGAEQGPNIRIGVDVMKVELKGSNQNIDEYFKLMNRQFTPNEWKQIKSVPGRSIEDKRKLMENFMRTWCLKESYVKAIGVGITIPLTSIDFEIQSEISTQSVVTDTRLRVDGHLQENWTFEEIKIDQDHILAVAIENYPKINTTIDLYEKIDYDTLMKGSVELGEVDQVLCEAFMKKPYAPKCKSEEFNDNDQKSLNNNL